MNGFTYAFLACLAIATGVRLWLSLRQVRHVRAHREHVPDLLRPHISTYAHRKAADFTVARTQLGLVELLFAAAVVLVWTLGGGLDALDTAWHAVAWSPALTGTAVVLSVVAIGALAELPLDAWRTYRVEGRFGFNHMSPAVFVGDLIRQSLLLLLLGGPMMYLVLVVIERSGTYWWLATWAVWAGFTMLVVWAYPVIIAPVFNRFQPLRDGELRVRVNALLERLGFPARDIYVMDGSRRSAHGNAYFTGVGRHRRIVFFDTLLTMLRSDEVEAVLAHEVAHYRLRHVQRRLALMLCLSLLALAALGWASTQPGFFVGLGLSQPSGHGALALLLLLSPILMVFVQPGLAARARRHEFEADAWAAAQVGAQPLISALTRLYRNNSSTLTPDPLYSAFHDTHPPAIARLTHLTTYDEPPSPAMEPQRTVT